MLWIKRLKHYYKRCGIIQTIKHSIYVLAYLPVRRVMPPYSVIFCVDLTRLARDSSVLTDGYVVKVCKNRTELSRDDRASLDNHHGGDIVEHHLKERYSRDACLWLLKKDETCCGLVWTLPQHPIKKYYWPLGPLDVHCFSNEIFPELRGQGLNAILIRCVLSGLKNQGYQRAFIETDEDNLSQIKALSRTSFTVKGHAKVRCILGRRIVIWRNCDRFLNKPRCK